jgi:type IV secretory pathway VirB10-like protein
MTDIDEQRKKVEELKRKILEQKKKGDVPSTSELPISKSVDEAKEQAPPVQVQQQEIKQQPKIESQQRLEEVKDKTEKIVPRQQQEEKPHTETEKNSQVQHAVPVVSLQAYAQALKQAWANGSISQDEENLLQILRKCMGISDEEHANLEQEVRLEIYLYAIVDCWKNGSLTAQDLDRLDTLREKFNISAEEHMRLEKQVRQEILKQR